MQRIRSGKIINKSLDSCACSSYIEVKAGNEAAGKIEDTIMNNKQLIELLGADLNAECLSMLEVNNTQAVDSWNLDISEARDLAEDHFEIASKFSKTGNPVIIRF